MLLRITALSLLIFLNTQALGEKHRICNHIFSLDEDLPLNQNEEILICGTDKSNDGWKQVPLAQAELQLRLILQNLGYLDPKFEHKGFTMDVTMGPRTMVRKLKVEGADGILRPWKKRKIVDYPLMTSKLDEVEEWASVGIRSRGYACPDIHLTAQAWDRTVIVNSNLKEKKVFGPVKTNGLDGLDQRVLERYRPFDVGDPYDVRQAQLMVSRMLSDGLFQSAYFTTTCSDTEALLQLNTSVGKPKILRFGVGASTEEFPFVDVSFRNARLDNKASFFTTTFHASPINISLALNSELYWIPGSDRTFLGPRFLVERRSETSFEGNRVSAGGDLGRNWDLWGHRINGRAGPMLNYSKTVRGSGPTDATYPTAEASVQVMSHLYESSIRDQYEGWIGQFAFRGQAKGLGSEVNVSRYRLELKKLWNIGSFSPPLFVLGTRVEGTIVDTFNQSFLGRDNIPTEDRIYMGGNENLRGFPRQSLNNGKLGYLTAAYAGFELRLIEELPFRIQPFLLWDMAQLGNRRQTLDAPVYISQGLGVRWASPFGTLRGSAAQGNIWHGNETSRQYKEGWVYFISFGQEF